MSKDQFLLTPQPIRVTNAAKQPLNLALDVSDYDEINALMGLLALVGSSSGVTIRLITGMQVDSEDGWVTLVTFSAQTTANSFDLQNATTGLLRYIRWEVLSLGGATAVTFMNNGMLVSRG